MPRKRVITREIDITIARCLFVNPGKKQQKRLNIQVPGSFNPRQIDRKRPAAPDPKLIFVKCTKTTLARARYEMPLTEFLKNAEMKGILYYGEEEKENKETPNENGGGVCADQGPDPGAGTLLSETGL